MVGDGRGRRRKRKERRAEAAAEADMVDLSSAEHAWWADREGLDAGVPHGKRRKAAEPPPAEPSGNTFTAYFSAQSLYDEVPDPDAPPMPEQSPYLILGVAEAATWEEITAAHRRLAKIHHPDRLMHPTAAEQSESEARIRDLNIAYSELRRRRGK